MTAVVSAFVPLKDHPRPIAEYEQLGKQLMAVNNPVWFAKGDLELCWLYQYLLQEYDLDTSRFTHSVGDNPDKNSLGYMIVQAQKTEWLEVASLVDNVSDVFVWIDYGIFHLPGVTVEVIESFLHRAASEQTIAIPGCWGKDQYPYDDRYPCWRFCGGVMVVPRQYVEPFNYAMKREYVRWLTKTRNVSWEVNTLARLEQQDLDFPVWHYFADHDASMFTNYRQTEVADGQTQRGFTEVQH